MGSWCVWTWILLRFSPLFLPGSSEALPIRQLFHAAPGARQRQNYVRNAPPRSFGQRSGLARNAIFVLIHIIQAVAGLCQSLEDLWLNMRNLAKAQIGSMEKRIFSLP